MDLTTEELLNELQMEVRLYGSVENYITLLKNRIKFMKEKNYAKTVGEETAKRVIRENELTLSMTEKFLVEYRKRGYSIE